VAHSKIGFHVWGHPHDWDWLQEYVRRVKPCIIKVGMGATDEQYWSFWEWCNNNGIMLLGRKYIDYQDHFVHHPDEIADAIIDLVRRGCPIKTWGGLNEYYCGGRVEDMERLARFDIRVAERLHAEGIAYAAWDGYENAMYLDNGVWVNHGYHLPLVQQALRTADYREYHQYWHHPIDAFWTHQPQEAVWLRGDWGEATWWLGRQRIVEWLLGQIDPSCLKPRINTETGIETYSGPGKPPWGGEHQGGWRSYTNAENYAAQLMLADTEFWIPDHKLLGATPFTWGTDGGRWDSYDMTPRIYELMADHIISYREEEEEGEVPSWMIDLAGQLPEHATARYSIRSVADIQYLVVHHVGSAWRAANVTDLARRTAAYQVNTRGWPGIAYHYCIAKNGDVAKTQPHGLTTYHAGEYNPVSVGILLEGLLTENDPTPEQVASLHQLISYLLGELNLAPTSIKGHYELRPTACPGVGWFAPWRNAYIGSNQDELTRLRLLIQHHEEQRALDVGAFTEIADKAISRIPQ
jgi:hypothetical protein